MYSGQSYGRSLDALVSICIYGVEDDRFKPSSCEADAWKLVSWLLRRGVRVEGHRINPSYLCQRVISCVATESQDNFKRLRSVS